MWESWFIIGCVALAFFVQPGVAGDKTKVWFWVYRTLGWGLLALGLSENYEEFLNPQFAEITAYVCLVLAVFEILQMLQHLKSIFPK